MIVKNAYCARAYHVWTYLRPHIPPPLREMFKHAALSTTTRVLRTILENHMMILTVETSNICNANCQFCAYRYQKRTRDVISDELFKHSVRQFAKSGGGILSLTPIVGDPLVDKDLINKINFAKKMQSIKYILLYTNLIGLDHFNVRKLLTSGLDELNVSICIGSKQMYNKVFGVDKYDQVMKNLHSLLEENRKLKNKVRIHVHVKGDNPSNIMSSLDYQRISDLYGRNTCHVDIAFDNWTGIIGEDDLPEGNMSRQVKCTCEPCSELYNGMIVFATGNVGICWRRDLEATLVIGNIYEESLDAIWKGRNLRNIRQDWSKGHIPIICRTCFCYTPLSHLLDLVKMQIFRKEQVKFV